MPAYEPLSEVVLSWVADCFGVPSAGIVSTERLVGGITADVDRIVVRGRAGRIHRTVLRRWTDNEPWTDNLVEREALALSALAQCEFAAPRLHAADPTGDQAGVRCLLMSEVPGRVILAPTDLGAWIDELARTQARIHQLPTNLAASAAGWFEPDADFEWISDTGLRREAVAAARGDLAAAPPVFAHGDYQHFNVLWERGQVTGVVDWTMAGTGPRGIDVGHCRLNIAALFSAEAAELYLQRYHNASGVPVDPTADLRALLGWDPDWLRFIPIQVAGRAAVNLDGMLQRVLDTIRRSLANVD